MPTNFNPFAYGAFKIRNSGALSGPGNEETSGSAIQRIIGVGAGRADQTIDLKPGDSAYDTIQDYKAKNPALASWIPGVSTATLFGTPAGSIKAQKPSGISLTSGAQQRRYAGGISNTILTGPLGLSMLNKSTQKRLLGT